MEITPQRPEKSESQDNSKNVEETEQGRNTRSTRNTMLWILGLGTGALLIFSFSAGSLNLWPSLFGTLWTVAAAAYLVGVVIGFLFGIPRAVKSIDLLTEEGNAPVGNSPSAQLDDLRTIKSRHDRLETNTNLQDISDWLTKMIVGIGLTQLHKVTGMLV